jgi:hypothetical protein
MTKECRSQKSACSALCRRKNRYLTDPCCFVPNTSMKCLLVQRMYWRHQQRSMLQCRQVTPVLDPLPPHRSRHLVPVRYLPNTTPFRHWPTHMNAEYRQQFSLQCAHYRLTPLAQAQDSRSSPYEHWNQVDLDHCCPNTTRCRPS